MAYTTKEESIQEGAPLEVYKFEGTFDTYRYTSEPEAVTVNGETYQPLAGLSRRAAKAGIHKDTDLNLIIELPYDTDVVVAYAYAKSPPRLALEIRRSLAYYTSKYRGESVTKIVLTGGGSLLRGVGRFFEDDLGIPVAFSNPMQNIPYIGDGDIENLSKLVPFMGVAVGLALRQIPQKHLARNTLSVDIETSYEFGSTAQAGGGAS